MSGHLLLLLSETVTAIIIGELLGGDGIALLGGDGIGLIGGDG